MGYFLLALLATSIYFLVMVIAIVKMQPDYFIRSEEGPAKLKRPILWVIAKIAKNIIGLCLIILGALMLILPGQGLLTILMGLFFLDLPGKKRLELTIVRKKWIRDSINWIRQKANQPPLKL